MNNAHRIGRVISLSLSRCVQIGALYSGLALTTSEILNNTGSCAPEFQSKNQLKEAVQQKQEEFKLNDISILVETDPYLYQSSDAYANSRQVYDNVYQLKFDSKYGMNGLSVNHELCHIKLGHLRSQHNLLVRHL
ncbi:MAG: hypothetical protein AABX37_03120, partial [Nanoarchaeota archaeon]